MSDFTIRQATPADAAALVRLAREVGAEPEGWLISTSAVASPGVARLIVKSLTR